VAVLVALGMAIAPALAAGHAGEKPSAESSLKLKAKSIVFDRSKGDVRLEGEVHVERPTGDQVLAVDCQKMTARMVEGKIEAVQAEGDIRLSMGEFTAAATKADFDFAKNIVKLYGTPEKPATMRSPDMISTGPTIIFHLDGQRVNMPDGGVSEVPMKPPAGETKKKRE